MLDILVLVAALALPPRVAEPDPAPPADVAPEALRVLARIAAGEPSAAEVQEAAARRAATDEPDLARRRLAELLPRLTAEVRHDERSDRVVGLQTSGEVDYVRLMPGNTFIVRATWELSRLLDPQPAGDAARAASERLRRRDEVVRRATALYFERRRLRLALLVDPPREVRARAEAELELDRLTAELDALTGGIFARGRP